MVRMTAPSICQTIAERGEDIDVVLPPRSTAVPSGETGPLAQRDRHIEMITQQRRLVWQEATGLGQTSLVETTMGRCKALIGPRLRVRVLSAQQSEAATGAEALNRMLVSGHPQSVRCRQVGADWSGAGVAHSSPGSTPTPRLSALPSAEVSGGGPAGTMSWGAEENELAGKTKERER